MREGKISTPTGKANIFKKNTPKFNNLSPTSTIRNKAIKLNSSMPLRSKEGTKITRELQLSELLRLNIKPYKSKTT